MSKFVMLTQVCEESGREVYTHLDEGAVSRSTESRYSLKPVLVSIDHISMLREDEHMTKMMVDGHLPKGLDEKQGFTKVHLSRGRTYSSSCVTVVGHLEVIASKISDAINAR